MMLFVAWRDVGMVNAVVNESARWCVEW